MKQLSAFLPRLLVYTPACSEPLAEQALLDSAIDFCERSCAIRYTADPIPVEEGVTDYVLWAPTNDQTVTRVLKVFLDDHPIEAVMAEKRTPVPDSPAYPSGYTIIEDDLGLTIRLNQIPDKAYTLVAELALRPTKTARHLDDQLYLNWMDAVVNGALARLYAVPGQPFSNESSSMYYAMKAAKLTNSARIEGSYGRVRGSMAVKPRPFM